MKPKNTRDGSVSFRKTLLYAHHGWGKTTQFAHMQEYYGPGFILSGEAGLSSIENAGIDYLPFTSWDGETDPSQDLYSFKALFKWTKTPEFRDAGYKWIGIDSLTELSDLSMDKAEADAEEARKRANKENVNGFDIWNQHAQQMIGACKAIRDFPMHVLMTALAKEKKNDGEGVTEYWPMLAGSQVQTQLPGLFDNVLCGVRSSRSGEDSPRSVRRFIITDEFRGWHGKVRDQDRRLAPYEPTGKVTDLFRRLDMSPEEYREWVSAREAEKAKKAKADGKDAEANKDVTN